MTSRRSLPRADRLVVPLASMPAPPGADPELVQMWRDHLPLTHTPDPAADVHGLGWEAQALLLEQTLTTATVETWLSWSSSTHSVDSRQYRPCPETGVLQPTGRQASLATVVEWLRAGSAAPVLVPVRPAAAA